MGIEKNSVFEMSCVEMRDASCEKNINAASVSARQTVVEFTLVSPRKLTPAACSRIRLHA